MEISIDGKPLSGNDSTDHVKITPERGAVAQAARQLQPLSLGDQISTDSKARVHLDYLNEQGKFIGSMIIEPASTIKLNGWRKLWAVTGRFMVEVYESFEIKTDKVYLRNKTTLFEIAVNGGQTNLTVLNGVVLVSEKPGNIDTNISSTGSKLRTAAAGNTLEMSGNNLLDAKLTPVWASEINSLAKMETDDADAKLQDFFRRTLEARKLAALARLRLAGVQETAEWRWREYAPWSPYASSPTAGGTTSLVGSAIVTPFGTGFEAGGFHTVQQGVVSFRAQPSIWIGNADSRVRNSVLKTLDRIEGYLAVSTSTFDTSLPLLARSGKISEAGARFQILNSARSKLDPSSITRDNIALAPLTDAEDRLELESERLSLAFTAQIPSLRKLPLNERIAAIQTAVSDAAQQFSSSSAALAAPLERGTSAPSGGVDAKTLATTAVSFEFVSHRTSAESVVQPSGPVLPGFYNFRAALSHDFPSRTLNLTANTAVSIASSAFRDASLGLDFGYREPPSSSLIRPSLHVAGSLGYLKAPRIETPVPQLPGLKQSGVLGEMQAKVVFPSSASSVQFPLSVSWQNRTEFTTRSEVRWQLGFLYRFSRYGDR